jgi:hypothetical protein
MVVVPLVPLSDCDAADVGAAVSVVDESLLHEMAPIPTAPASARATNLLDRMNVFLSGCRGQVRPVAV